jgi:hypothetical protein
VFDERREAAAATLHGIIDITVDYDFTNPMFLAFIAEMRVERLAMDLEELFEFRSINLAHPFDASRYIWLRGIVEVLTAFTAFRPPLHRGLVQVPTQTSTDRSV